MIGVSPATLLLQRFEWPSFVWLTVALAAVGFAGTPLVIPPGRAEHPPRFDGLSAALSLLAAAVVVFARLEVELNYAVVGPAIVLFASGMALSRAPSTSAITQSLPPAKQGVASGVNDTAREFGSALGIAILGSVLTQI